MSVPMGVRLMSIGIVSASFTLAMMPGCGSSDDKKKVQAPGYQGGAGESNAGAPSVQSRGGAGGTTTGSGGESAAAGQMGSDGGMSTVAGASASGAGGEATGDVCAEGFADCDADATDCETPVDTLTQCGACDVSCSDANGSVECRAGACVMTACTAGFADCDNDGTNGCELTLAEDDENCGECGRNCAAAGSTCDTSMCTPVAIDARGSSFLSTFGAGAVYLMLSNAIPVSSYTLARIPVDGSAPTTVWAAGGNIGFGALVADDADVYWAVSGTPPSVMKKAATAAPDALPTVVFQPDAQPHYLTMQGANFYWASLDNGLIYARARSAAMASKGVAIVTTSQGHFFGFVASPSHLFFVAEVGQATSLKMVPIPGGGTPTVVPDAVVTPGAPLMVVGEKLYFIRRGNANALNGLYSFTPGDQTVQQLVAHNNLDTFIVDDAAIYYKHANEYGVYKVKLTGGAGVRIAPQVGNGEFAGQDEKYLYTPTNNQPVYKVVK